MVSVSSVIEDFNNFCLYREPTYLYVRVSSRDQNVARQIEALRQYVQSERDMFVDKKSGVDFERTAYQIMKGQLRSGDTVYVKSLDRFGRNKSEIKRELEWFNEHGIILRILDIPTTMMDLSGYGTMQKAIMEMINNVLIEVLGTIAEQERLTIKARQREGIDIALKEGVRFGRRRIEYPENWADYYRMWKLGTIKACQIIRETGLGHATFYNMVKRYEKEAGFIYINSDN